MEQPPTGQEVVVILAGESEALAIWDGQQWLMGVNDDPIDRPLGLEVIDWRWRDS